MPSSSKTKKGSNKYGLSREARNTASIASITAAKFSYILHFYELIRGSDYNKCRKQYSIIGVSFGKAIFFTPFAKGDKEFSTLCFL